MNKSNDEYNNSWMSYVDLMSVLVIVLMVFLFTVMTDITTLNKMIMDQDMLLAQKDQAVSGIESDDQTGQVEEMAGVKLSIIKALQTAFEENDVLVSVDSQTGNITMDSKILFDYDRSVLKGEGKEALDTFFDIYFRTLTKETFKKYLATIQVVGYTDAEGAYDYNLMLSQRRAMSVVTYLLDTQYQALSSREKLELRHYIIGFGKSENDLVYINGLYQEAASRRVVIGFRLKDQESIDKLTSVFRKDDE